MRTNHESKMFIKGGEIFIEQGEILIEAYMVDFMDLKLPFNDS